MNEHTIVKSGFVTRNLVQSTNGKNILNKAHKKIWNVKNTIGKCVSVFSPRMGVTANS